MAYTKYNWVDDQSAVTASRMNNIENGIYNNSSDITTLNNNVNPSGTATTTQTDFTEGQLTQKLGLKYIKMKGQTSQYSTTGKNLMALKTLTTSTLNGITFTPVYNGDKLEYINANGTSTAVASYILQDANVEQASTYNIELKAGTYTVGDFSGTSDVGKAVYLRYTTDNSTYTTVNSGNSTKTFTLSQDGHCACFIRIASGVTLNNVKFYPQIEKSSTATSYEPFTGRRSLT